MRIRTHNKEKKQENMETEHIKKNANDTFDVYDVQYQKSINKLEIRSS